MLEPSFQVGRVSGIFLMDKFHSDNSLPHVGAASDKVSALEKAGAIVTDSPAKIGSSMLKVTSVVFVLTSCI